MNCPNCKRELDNVDIAATIGGVGEINDKGIMEADAVDEELTAISCGYCGAILSLNIVKGWNWRS